MGLGSYWHEDVKCCWCFFFFFFKYQCFYCLEENRWAFCSPSAIFCVCSTCVIAVPVLHCGIGIFGINRHPHCLSVLLMCTLLILLSNWNLKNLTKGWKWYTKSHDHTVRYCPVQGALWMHLHIIPMLVDKIFIMYPEDKLVNWTYTRLQVQILRFNRIWLICPESEKDFKRNSHNSFIKLIPNGHTLFETTTHLYQKASAWMPDVGPRHPYCGFGLMEAAQGMMSLWCIFMYSSPLLWFQPATYNTYIDTCLKNEILSTVTGIYFSSLSC